MKVCVAGSASSSRVTRGSSRAAPGVPGSRSRANSWPRFLRGLPHVELDLVASRVVAADFDDESLVGQTTDGVRGRGPPRSIVVEVLDEALNRDVGDSPAEIEMIPMQMAVE